MRICLIVEGAYPYTRGGVSSWMVQLMEHFPEHEFVIQTISAKRLEEPEEFKCPIPDNVGSIQEIYIMDEDYIKRGNNRVKLSASEYKAFESLMFGEQVDWAVIFNFFASRQVSINRLLSSKEFFQMSLNYYNSHFQRSVFSDYLWTMRSMYMPMFVALKSSPIQADIYHAVSTGYAGLLGCMMKSIFNKPLLLSEHGIYTREREEEIIKAEWVKDINKELWISQFKKISKCCYDYSDRVISLFKDASEFQGELGCPEEKRMVIPNGIDALEFENIEQKDADDEHINIGAILRISPIKDVKTLISAYGLAKMSDSRLKLWIMGPLDDDPKYVQECRDLVDTLKIPDVVFTGNINVREYIGKMDILMLSSLSEGQPLAILEGFAAKKPFIVTNVGNCADLVHGENDNLGDAGIVVPVMNVSKMSAAIHTLANDENLREEMGRIGYKRVLKNHNRKEVFDKYADLYKEYDRTQ